MAILNAVMETRSIIVAGHLCLDFIPDLSGQDFSCSSVVPGELRGAGPLVVAPGGAVANTGGALSRMGFDCVLMAASGDDELASMLEIKLAQRCPSASIMLSRAHGFSSSYSIALCPKGEERFFLHHEGHNEAFSESSVAWEALESAEILHLAYPTALPSLYTDSGASLESMLARAKRAGVTTSIDLSYPSSRASKANWPAIARRCAAYCDIVSANLDEAELFAGRVAPGRDRRKRGFAVCEKLIELGFSIVLVKLGDRGLCLMAAEQGRLEGMGRAKPRDIERWSGASLHEPAFAVSVVGTVGAGDAAVAGFLGALLKGLSPSECAERACAVGAFSVEAMDAVSGIPAWEMIETRIASGWEKVEGVGDEEGL